MRLTRLMLGSLAIIMTATGCAIPLVPSGTGGDAILVVALDSPPLTLDPANITELASAHVSSQVYETLVEFNAKTSTFDPLLAQSWTVSGDGRVWTFTLRYGVTFHDGTPLTAGAVVDNFNRWMDVTNPYHHGDFDYWQLLFGGFKGSGSIVRSVEQVDDLRFRLTLEQPWSPLLAALSMFPFAIVSPTAMRTDIDAIYRRPVGTGPFRFVQWRSDGEVELEANAAYWGGRPKLDGVRFQVITDRAARLNALRDGKAHVVEGGDAALAREARKISGVRMVLRPSTSVAFLSINQSAAPFDDARVRRAIAYAINRKTLVDAGYGGLAQVADGFLPPAIAGGAEPAASDLYNRDEAVRLLNEAGVGDGVVAQLWYPTQPLVSIPDPRAVAQSIASDLRAVGIVVSLNSADWPTYQRRALEGGYPLYLQGWTGDSPDADDYLPPLFASSVVLRSIAYANPNLQALLDRARGESDSATRSGLYRQAAAMLGDDMPRVPLVYPQSPVLLAGSVKGFMPGALGLESYRAVTLGN